MSVREEVRPAEVVVSVASAPVLPPLLARVIDAARAVSPQGHSEALTAFGALALVLVPSAGVLDVGRDDVARSVQAIAARHLGLTEALIVFYETLERVSARAPEAADDLEAAALHVHAVSDAAHVLFGLALGLTLADLAGGRAAS